MIRPTRSEENKLYRRGFSIIAGADEVGRGAWAGPIVAAAVILYPDDRFRGIRDSKQISPAAREYWYDIIIRAARAYQVTMIDVEEIDRVGLGVSNREVLRQAILQLPLTVDAALVDAIQIEVPNVHVHAITHGDTKVVSIAAASILAKVTRDNYMKNVAPQYVKYGFDRHKGYGTRFHQQQLAQHGVSRMHRRSFTPIRALAA